jgi:DNA-binding MarR family transcriptional regulator
MKVDSPVAPKGRVAAGTHPVELRRLAYQEATHPSFDPLNVQCMMWLFRAFNATLNAQAEELRPLGLSPSAFNVLMALHNSADRMLEPCQLAQRLLISRPSVTGLLDTLQAKDLVTREPHGDDRRRILVHLTSAGESVLESHYATHYAEQAAAFAELSADERETLVTLLRRVRGAVPSDFAEDPGAP